MSILRTRREASGLNQRELAEKVHIPQSIISDLELEKRKPWPRIKRKLARVLKTTEDELFPKEQ